ncbi:hypothetical protein RN001_005846 [Aquatica leii]|uniref:Uncharacterized protein n=1 Tax=Aquatica leii TaxID=1421715 RepID=A0AAN7SI89_9COLE|nr:hypothetical protein RN001_005846 [Aquatica leii]
MVQEDFESSAELTVLKSDKTYSQKTVSESISQSMTMDGHYSLEAHSSTSAVLVRSNGLYFEDEYDNIMEHSLHMDKYDEIQNVIEEVLPAGLFVDFLVQVLMVGRDNSHI